MLTYSNSIEEKIAKPVRLIVLKQGKISSMDDPRDIIFDNIDIEADPSDENFVEGIYLSTNFYGFIYEDFIGDV